MCTQYIAASAPVGRDIAPHLRSAENSSSGTASGSRYLLTTPYTAGASLGITDARTVGWSLNSIAATYQTSTKAATSPG